MSKIGLHAGAPRAVLAVGAAGAIVGGSIGAARNIARVRKGEMTREAAVKDALREAGTTGASTAAATAVVGALNLGGLLSLLGLVTVSVGAKYLVDKALDARSCRKAAPALPAGTGAAQEKAAPAKAEAPKKTAAKGTTTRKTRTAKSAAKAATPKKTTAAPAKSAEPAVGGAE